MSWADTMKVWTQPYPSPVEAVFAVRDAMKREQPTLNLYPANARMAELLRRVYPHGEGKEWEEVQFL